jgi:nitrate reductase delta subunit
MKGGFGRATADRAAGRQAAPRVVHQVASWCLSYPDPPWSERLPLLRAAAAGLPAGTARECLRRFLADAVRTPLSDAQRRYVETFDLTTKRALYLSYWTDGDTRRRGEVLAGFKARYRATRFVVDTGGELPDYLPLVLEYAAVADPVDGPALLQEYRASLELLRLSLLDSGSVHADVLTAVCATLPGASPANRAQVHRMAAAGPPLEMVGLTGGGR